MSSEIASLEQQVPLCLRRDQRRLRGSLDRIKSDAKSGKEIAAELAGLQTRIEASSALREARAASVPALEYPDLPVAERKDEILAAIRRYPVVIVCGETGSGKTTQLPKICLEAGRGLTGYIGHTQPRRIAARTVAARIAEELKQPLGQAVGYKVRFQDKTRPESLIKLMTDGILLAETQHDRFLDQYDTLIVDEAHERSLNIDFLLGYLKWLLPRRPDFKLVITSATIDPERFSRHFGDAPIINVSGRTYPVDVRYRPVEVEEGDETDKAEQSAILGAVDELWRELPGDILIFLSGEREIRETSESLRKHHPSKCEILPLYSRLSQSEQEKVFRPTGSRRIVLATNVAETSLTVPGIRSVIDTGHARISRYSHRSKLQRLPIEKVSRASADQRSGRCGRVGPGIAIRLYSEQDFLNRPEFTDPEILRTHLAAVILQMHALKLGDISRFPFVEPPDPRMIRDGLRTLQEVNALDEHGQITDIGRKLARLPVDPRLARMLLAGADEHCLTEIAVIVAALSVPDPRERPADKAAHADQKHARFKDEQSDFLALLKLWRDFEEQKQHLSRAKLRQYCRDHFLSYVRMTEWHDIHGQIMEVIKGELELKLNQAPGEYGEIHRALLAGLLSHVSLLQEQAEYTGARGAKLFIHPGSFLFKSKPKWIVSAEQVETTKVYARTVAKIEPEWIEQVGAHRVKQQHYDPHWERKAARVAVHERTLLFGLTVQAGRKIPYERVNPTEARELFIRYALVRMDYDSKAPFFLHNLKLLSEADYLQQKGRRVDLLVDEAWLYRYFDERIPSEVVNGVTFERWRKGAEKRQPDLLKLTHGDITVKEDAALDVSNFPDHFELGPLRVALQYRFEPGHEDDGVTAIIPLHLLNPLEPEPFRWLVPGLLREKVTALIKSLPKTLRIHFVPVPDHAERVLPMLDFGRGSFYAQISSALKKTGGIAVSTQSFREELLPAHLRMNFAVVNEANQVIDRARPRRTETPPCRRRRPAVPATGAGGLSAHRQQDLGFRRAAGLLRWRARRPDRPRLPGGGRRGRNGRCARVRHPRGSRPPAGVWACAPVPADAGQGSEISAEELGGERPGRIAVPAVADAPVPVPGPQGGPRLARRFARPADGGAVSGGSARCPFRPGFRGPAPGPSRGLGAESRGNGENRAGGDAVLRRDRGSFEDLPCRLSQGRCAGATGLDALSRFLERDALSAHPRVAALSQGRAQPAGQGSPGPASRSQAVQGNRAVSRPLLEGRASQPWPDRPRTRPVPLDAGGIPRLPVRPAAQDTLSGIGQADGGGVEAEGDAKIARQDGRQCVPGTDNFSFNEGEDTPNCRFQDYPTDY